MISIICDCCGKTVGEAEEYASVSAKGYTHNGFYERRFRWHECYKLCAGCYGEIYDKYLTRYERERGNQ